MAIEVQMNNEEVERAKKSMERAAQIAESLYDKTPGEAVGIAAALLASIVASICCTLPKAAHERIIIETGKTYEKMTYEMLKQCKEQGLTDEDIIDKLKKGIFNL